MAGQVPVGTFCRINNAMVSWDDPTDGHPLDMFVSQDEGEDLYFAVVLQHEDVKGGFGVRRIVRCLALGFETGTDHTFWMLGSQHLEPI